MREWSRPARIRNIEPPPAALDDSKLNTPIQLFGPRPFSMAAAMFITVGDWADHYSQEANYLRLNGILPPTAQPRTGM